MIEEIKLGIYAGSETKPRAHYGVPKALLYAFSHLVLYFCIGCRSNKSTTAPIQGKWFEECREYIVRGKQQLIILHNTGHSGEAEIFKTLDCESIVMLVVQRLVNASRKPVLKTYEQYLYTLVSHNIQAVILRAQAKHDCACTLIMTGTRSPSITQHRSLRRHPKASRGTLHYRRHCPPTTRSPRLAPH